MRKFLLACGFAGAFAFAPVVPANAFLPGQTEVIGAAATVNDVIEIKRHKQPGSRLEPRASRLARRQDTARPAALNYSCAHAAKADIQGQRTGSPRPRGRAGGAIATH